jgi:hypothetical protein
VSYATVKRQCNDVVQRLGVSDMFICDSGIAHRNNGPQINMSLTPSLCTTSLHLVLQWYNSPKQRNDVVQRLGVSDMFICGPLFR